MKRILKWSVPVDDQAHEIGGGTILRAECQQGDGSVQVWTCETVGVLGKSTTVRRVQVVGTGQELHDAVTPLASALAAGGRLVWHVVDLGPAS